MNSSNPRPKWWQLYLIFPLLLALFLLESRLKLSQRGHIVVQIGILILAYGLVHMWLKGNTVALSKMDQRQYRGTSRVIRLPLVELPEDCNDKQPMFQLPASELKGVLSSASDGDHIRAEAFPVNKISEDLTRK